VTILGLRTARPRHSRLGAVGAHALQDPADAWPGLAAKDIADGNAAAARARCSSPTPARLPMNQALPDLLDEWRDLAAKFTAEKTLHAP